MNEAVMKSTLRESYRFAIVGILATIVNYLVNMGFMKLGFTPGYSSAFGYISGIFIGFPLNKYWAFSSTKEKGMGKETFRYVTVYFITFVLNSFLAILFYEIFDNIFSFDELSLLKSMYYFPVIAITTVLNFLGCKIFVFKK